MSSRLQSSRALWNRTHLDLRSEEVIAQILDRGDLADWCELYRIAAADLSVRKRMHRVVRRVPVPYGHFWLAALRNLGEEIDWSSPLPSDEAWI